MTSEQSREPKQPHAITVRAWPLEVSGQGLGIVGVLVVVALVVLAFKSDLAPLGEGIRAKLVAVATKP